MTFTLNLPEPGTYNYTLKEINDGQEGIIYDEHEYPVQITVSEPATPGSQPEVSVTYDGVEGQVPTFQNLYSYLLPETGGIGTDGYTGGGMALIVVSLFSLYMIKNKNRYARRRFVPECSGLKAYRRKSTNK